MRRVFWTLLLCGAMGGNAQPAEPLTLPQAVAIAQEQGIAAVRARSSVESSAQRTRQARAGMLPSADLGSSYSRPGPNLGGDSWLNAASRNEYNGILRSSLGVEWKLFSGFTGLGALQAAELRDTLAAVELERIHRSIQAEVTQAYLTATREMRLTALRREALRFSEERAQIAANNLRVGASTPLTELQSRLDLQEDSVALARQEFALQAALRRLNGAMAREAESPIQLDLDGATVSQGDNAAGTDSEIAPLPPRAELWNRLERNSTELRQADLALRLALREQAIANGSLLPSLSLFGDYVVLNRFEPEAAGVEADHHQGMLYGAQLTLPLFAGGSRDAERVMARQASELARREAAESRHRLQQEFAEAWSGCDEAATAWALESSSAEVSRQALALALENFRLGAIGSLELRTLQKQALEAQLRREQARAELELRQQLLLIAAGERVP